LKLWDLNHEGLPRGVRTRGAFYAEHWRASRFRLPKENVMAKDYPPFDDVQEPAGTVHAKPTPVFQQANSASQNRGQRAPKEGSGDVTGSGAGAGGAGGEEDFDSDPAGGGGGFPTTRENSAPDKGADAPVHGSR
jgi:hypothetical protein